MQQCDDEKQLWLDLDPAGEDALLQLRGAKAQDLRSGFDAEGVVWFATARSLAARERLTVVITSPKSYLREPTAQMQMRWFVEDCIQILSGVIGLALLLSYYLAVWFKVGGGSAAGVVFPRYAPASMRFVRRVGVRPQGLLRGAGEPRGQLPRRHRGLPGVTGHRREAGSSAGSSGRSSGGGGGSGGW